MTAKDVLHFWFDKCTYAQRFGKNKKFDSMLKKKFLELHEAIVRGEMALWRKSARGRLAEIIVLDQFSRNMFRGTPRAFQYDSLALALAQEALRARADNKVSKQERMFFYMPFMHSESKKMHREALKLFSQPGNKEAVRSELGHKKIIDHFGRYPHRNAILGRKSTPAEKKFLKTHEGF